MEKPTEEKVRDLMHGIDRNYPSYATTFSKCRNDGCENSARGGGECAHCFESKMVEYVGADLACDYHEAILDKAMIAGRIQKAVEEYDDRKG